MKSLLSLTFLLLLLLAFGACSPYQSDGRKFLEEQGIDFALRGQSLIQNQACQQAAELSIAGFKAWPLPADVDRKMHTALFRVTDDAVTFRVIQQKNPSSRFLYCDQHYSSMQDFTNDERLAIYGSLFAIDQLSLLH